MKFKRLLFKLISLILSLTIGKPQLENLSSDAIYQCTYGSDKGRQIRLNIIISNMVYHFKRLQTSTSHFPASFNFEFHICLHSSQRSLTIFSLVAASLQLDSFSFCHQMLFKGTEASQKQPKLFIKWEKTIICII